MTWKGAQPHDLARSSHPFRIHRATFGRLSRSLHHASRSTRMAVRNHLSRTSISRLSRHPGGWIWKLRPPGWSFAAAKLLDQAPRVLQFRGWLCLLRVGSPTDTAGVDFHVPELAPTVQGRSTCTSRRLTISKIPAPDIYCEEQTFTRQSRPVDPSTAGRSLRLKEKALLLVRGWRLVWSYVRDKRRDSQVGSISGPLTSSSAIKHDHGNSTVTALPLVYLKWVRVRLLATTYARGQHTSNSSPVSSSPNINTDKTFLIIRSRKLLMAEHMNLMQLSPAVNWVINWCSCLAHII